MHSFFRDGSSSPGRVDNITTLYGYFLYTEGSVHFGGIQRRLYTAKAGVGMTNFITRGDRNLFSELSTLCKEMMRY